MAVELALLNSVSLSCLSLVLSVWHNKPLGNGTMCSEMTSTTQSCNGHPREKERERNQHE